MGEEDQAKDEFILHFMIQDQFRGTGRTVCCGWVFQASSFRSWSSVSLRIRCVLILRVVSSTSWKVLRFCAKKKVFLSPLRLLINYFQRVTRTRDIKNLYCILSTFYRFYFSLFSYCIVTNFVVCDAAAIIFDFYIPYGRCLGTQFWF